MQYFDGHCKVPVIMGMMMLNVGEVLSGRAMQ